MRKFEYKYKIDETHKTIVAMSTFAGKTIVGVARCAPTDVFDIEKGKNLAAARCRLKIAEKRLKRAESCNSVASEYVEYWQKEKAKMDNYEKDSAKAYIQAVQNLSEIEKSFI